MVIFHSYVNVYQRAKHQKSKRMCSSIFFSIIQVFLIIHFKLALNYIMISSSCSPSSNVLSIIRKIITKLLIQIGELEMGNFQHSQRSYLPNTRFLWLALYIYISQKNISHIQEFLEYGIFWYFNKIFVGYGCGSTWSTHIIVPMQNLWEISWIPIKTHWWVFT